MGSVLSLFERLNPWITGTPLFCFTSRTICQKLNKRSSNNLSSQRLIVFDRSKDHILYAIVSLYTITGKLQGLDRVLEHGVLERSCDQRTDRYKHFRYPEPQEVDEGQEKPEQY